MSATIATKFQSVFAQIAVAVASRETKRLKKNGDRFIVPMPDGSRVQTPKGVIIRLASKKWEYRNFRNAKAGTTDSLKSAYAKGFINLA
jgi:hypothetical protein